NRRHSSPSVSAATWATMRWPLWTGSKDPPRSPTIHSGGPCRARRADLTHAPGLGMKSPDIAAGLLHILAVAQLVVGLDQLDQRLRRYLRPGIGGDQVLQVKN